MDNWFPDNLYQYGTDGYIKGIDKKWEGCKQGRLDRTFLKLIKAVEVLEKKVEQLEEKGDK